LQVQTSGREDWSDLIVKEPWPPHLEQEHARQAQCAERQHVEGAALRDIGECETAIADGETSVVVNLVEVPRAVGVDIDLIPVVEEEQSIVCLLYTSRCV